MKVVILAADYQTRFCPLTKGTARPLLPIRGRPAIEYIVNKAQLLEDADEIFIVTNGRFFRKIRTWLDNFANSIPIKLINDGSVNHKDRLGAIKDIAYVCDKEKIAGDLLVIGADNIFSSPLDEFVDFAKLSRPHNVIGTYGLNGKLKPGRFGVVRLDENKKIIYFYEKPARLNGGSTAVSICLYFFPEEKIHLIKEYIKEVRDLTTVGNYIQWLTMRETVYGYPLEGLWLDISDTDSYAEAVFTF